MPRKFPLFSRSNVPSPVPRETDQPGAARDVSDYGSWHQVSELLGEGVLIHLQGGRIVWFNSAACRLLDTSPEEFLSPTANDTWNSIHTDGRPMPPDERPPTTVLRTGKPVEGVVMGVQRAGTDLVWLRISSAPTTFSGELAAISIIRDVTAEIQSQRELDQTVVEINRTLIQPDLPSADGIRFLVRSESVMEPRTISGGFCGAYQLDDTRLAFFIGNVSGAEMRAAGLSAAARHTLRSAGALLDDPARALQHTHDTVSADWPGTTMTAICGNIGMQTDSASVSIASARHPRPLVIRRGNPSFVDVTGLPIGHPDFVQPESTSIVAERGDVMLLSTHPLVSSGADEAAALDRFSTPGEHAPTIELAELAERASSLAAQACVDDGVDEGVTVLAIEFT